MLDNPIITTIAKKNEWKLIVPCETLEKIKYILTAEKDTQSKICLLNSIESYYKMAQKKKPPTKIIKYDFKKREIVAFFEYLIDELGVLGESDL